MKLQADSNPVLLGIYAILYKTFDFLSKKGEVINNLTTIKDYSFKKLLCGSKGNSFGAKIHNGITNFYKRLAQGTVIGSYKKAGNVFKETMNKLNGIHGRVLLKDPDKIVEINGEKLTKLEWLKRLIQLNQEVLTNYKQNFATPKVNERFSRLEKATKELEKNFDKKGILWFFSKETLQSFVAEAELLGEKTKIQNEILDYRNFLSHSIDDFVNWAEKTILNITKNIDIKDSRQMPLLRNIERILKQLPENYKTAEGTKLEQILENNILKLKQYAEESGLPKQTISQINSLLGFKNLKQGKIQEILDIYKAILSKSAYKEVERNYKIAINVLDKSIETETSQYIDKLRDLTLGSAPTDILTMLSGIGTLGYFIGKSDDYKERTAVTLKYGIPALAGIATSLYGNAKLFAGSKSLIFGTVTMWITNRIGEIAYNLLLHKWEKESQNPKAN